MHGLLVTRSYGSHGTCLVIIALVVYFAIIYIVFVRPQFSYSASSLFHWTSKQVQHLHNLFMEADKDRSGAISKQEFTDFFIRKGMSLENAANMFFRADIDGDGEPNI